MTVFVEEESTLIQLPLLMLSQVLLFEDFSAPTTVG